MDFLPWKTVDLDGAFRVTAPESISEEVIQEVSNAVTFRFSGELSAVKLEILLTPPWGWEDCFSAEEQNEPPAGFICRLISRSTGRRTIVALEHDGMGLWFAETNFTSLLDGEEVRAEALLVRNCAAETSDEGVADQKGQIVGRSRIHTIRFTSRPARTDASFQLRWEPFPPENSRQLWRLQPGEPPTLELNEEVGAPLRRMMMSRSRRRNAAALQRDVLFTTICAAVWPLLISGVLHELQRVVDHDPALSGSEAIDALSDWQTRLLGLFASGLSGTDLPAHESLPLIASELKTPGGFMRLMLRMPALIQEETRLVPLAEAMAEAQSTATAAVEAETEAVQQTEVEAA